MDRVLKCFLIIISVFSFSGSILFAKTISHSGRSKNRVKKQSHSVSAINKHFKTASGGIITTSTGGTILCPGASITLTANPAPSTAAYQWLYEGLPIGAYSSTYLASDTGAYSVMVTYNGTTVTYPPITLTLGTSPVVPSFTINQVSQCGNSPVQFTNTTDSTNLTYSWNFGDQGPGVNFTSNQPIQSHRFVVPNGGGTQQYPVTLTATNSQGCSNSTTNYVTIYQPSSALGSTVSQPVSYNGNTYFTYCYNQADTVGFINQSNTANTNYEIIWGDGTAPFDSAGFASTQKHYYQIGTHKLQFIVTGQNGCIDTGVYYIFIGSSPSAGLIGPSDASICTGAPLTFTIPPNSNPPGTTYTINFNDGTTPLTYNSTPPGTITHIYSTTSCGISLPGGGPNSFITTITATNPCGPSQASFYPIYVSQKAKASFSVDQHTTCVSNAINLTNTSVTNNVSATGCSEGNTVWKISPSTGWTVQGGSLGNDYGSQNINAWMLGTDNINVAFNVPGIYTVTIESGSVTCGIDTVKQTVCVTAAPTATFKVDKTQGCGPLTVQTTNTSAPSSCGANTFLWTVNYSNPGCSTDTASYVFLNGTSDTSANPKIQFINAGLYSLSLTTTIPGGACSATTDTAQIITVKSKPTVTLPGTYTICQNNKIGPIANVANCYSATAATYLWTFTGGMPSTSTDSIPDSVLYNKPGTYIVSLAVTNECGTTTVSDTVVVNPTPVVSVPGPVTLCNGASVNTINFTSTTTGTTFNWTNDNTSIGLTSFGSDSIPGFTVINTGDTAQVAHITVTPVNTCTGLPVTFTITVNPQPTAPGVANTSLTYCQNGASSPLTATADSGKTLRWYVGPNLPPNANFTTTPPVPVTSVPAITNYYVTQVNSSGCESPPTMITVTVNPAITNNTIGSSQNICLGTVPATLTSTATISGGNNSYTYQWQYAGADGVTHSGDTTENYNLPDTLHPDTYKVWRFAYSGACQIISNTVTITIQGTLSNYGISGSQTICSGAVPAQLTGQIPGGTTGTITFQWQSSPDNSSWSSIPGATGSNYQPPALTATTYYQRIVSTTTCSAVSGPDTVTVNPGPVINAISNQIVCNGSTVQSIGFTSSTINNTTFNWTGTNTAIGLSPSSGAGSIPSFTAANATGSPITDSISVTATYASGGASCNSAPVTFTITVLPTISISANPSNTVCSGTQVPAFTPVNNALSFPNSSVTYLWTVSGNIGLSDGSGSQVPSFTAVNNSNSDLTATVTVTPVYNYNGESCNGTPVSYTIVVNAPPTTANAGSNQKICTTIYQLNGNTPIVGSGTWTQTAGPAVVITNANAPNATITGLQKGSQYQFTWTITNNTCSASTSNVVIDVLTDVHASFTKSQVNGCGQQTITFTNTSTPLDSAAYTWNFGNGQTSASIQPPVVLFKPAILNHDTTYYITLTGATSCDTSVYLDSITVIPGIKSIFTPNTTKGCSPLTINITNQSTGIASQYTYNFGDGSALLITNQDTAVKHIYTALKDTTYTIKLKAMNSCGADSSSYQILVHPQSVQANLVVNGNNQAGCAPYTVTFYNNSTGADVFNYDFGDGSKTTTFQAPETVSHTFTKAGTYVVTLVASNGCSTASTSQSIAIVAPPVVNFATDKPQYCINQTTVFTNNSSSSASITYLWDFGDNTTSNQVSPVHLYKTPGTYTVTLSAVSDTAGINCSATASHQIIVSPLPTVNFTSNLGTVNCAPFVLSVSSQPTNAVYVSWSFGDPSSVNDSTSGITAQHLYTRAGTYQLKMIAYNASGCSDTTVQTFLLNPSPVASFAVAENASCAPFPVSITNNSTNADNYQWYLNNAPVSTDQTPTNIVLTQPNQTYSLKLVVTNRYGCQADSAVQTLFASPKPVAAFSLQDSISCNGPLNIQVTNNSTNAASYTWSFGDNSPNDTSKVPTHLYGVNGFYKLKLVANFGLCSDSVTHIIQVGNPPKSIFTTNVTNGCSPLTVNITNQSTGLANQYTYDFGDGGTPQVFTTNQAVQHTYVTAKVDTFTLKLTAKNSCGIDSSSYKIVVYPDTVKANLVVNGNNLTGCAPFTVEFNNNSTGANNFSFDFGDGTKTTTSFAPEIVAHTFTQPGTHVVTLVASNPCSNASTSQTVTVVAPPVANFATDKSQYCLSQTTVFTNKSTSSPSVTYVWNFGDNTSGNQVNPVHIYQAPGTYTVTLTAVRDTAGITCMDTVSHQIIVSPLLSVNFTSNLGSINCAPFLLSASSQPTNATYVTWSFGDPSSLNDSTSGFTVQHLYTKPGPYKLKMIAYNATGCADTTIKTFLLNPSPVASFTVAKTMSGVPFQVAVTNNSSYADSFQWYINNALVSTDSIPNILLTQPNQRDILMLVVTNKYGCKPDTARDTLYTLLKPVAAFSLQDSVSCTGELNIIVTNNSTSATSYIWSFGDNSPDDTSKAPTHLYGDTGVYKLRLIAKNSLFSDTVTHIIQIANPPKAAFSADITSGCDSVITTFQNLSVYAVSYQWDFGDGSYSTVRNPVHTFGYTQSPYTVKLYAYGKFGCIDSAIMIKYVYVSVLRAGFEALPDSVIKIPDYTFTFNNLTTSNQMPGDSISYSWNFGDGSLPSTEKNPAHTYKDTGKFIVTLTATDTYGCKSTKTETVHVMTVPEYLYVPNAFEPASIKSELQTFNVRAAGLIQYNLRIFNKWGQLIFETSALDINGTPTEGWNGYMQGKPAPQDGYVWQIKAKFIDGTEWQGMKYRNSSTPSTTGIIHLIR